ncbi:PREDICTED: ALBINO3-like protein 3, mitochondrial [Camelina sativa]|uniref:ALBINO3-like protein 3, mitochondrial n=1 Tax=Camelina sativa TaxID=90675 RepID=A0ABM0SKQ6_CAMSA|nr:PREDICTED: ALBINO3-like protein 3, mitochondrial [Camelina sativa]
MDSELTRLRDVSIDGYGSNGHGLELGDLSQDLIGAGVSSYDYLTRPVISLLDSYHDLTGLPCILPVSASLKYIYIFLQIILTASSVHKVDKFAELAKAYKTFLNLLTVALYFLSFQMPQGSLLYWATNLSFSIAQQSILNHPVVSAKLGLQGNDTVQKETGNPILTNINEAQLSDSSSKGRLISVHNLTPKELVALFAKYLSGGHKEKSIPLLRERHQKESHTLKE